MNQDATSHAVKSESAVPKWSLGFWTYLMTDCILFGTLFATYAVLQGNTYGGPSGKDLFDLPFVLVETLILLASSFTCGLALLFARINQKKTALSLLAVTMGLGVTFLVMELMEFTHLVQEGHSWQASAFLSAFFTLVGTHGAHIAVGILWALVLLVYIGKRGLTGGSLQKMTLFSMFWHFLDVVWIFIFTIVYLMGVI